jgi:hypothetical protein
VPQDIPLDASDVLSFTPASLEKIEGAPVFTLRACTMREKRFHRRLLLESGIRFHDIAKMRAEMLNGLRHLWTPEAFDAHAPMVKALWEARDEFALQQKDDPDLEWSYDAEIEEAVDALEDKIAKSWPRLCEMVADNADYSELTFPIIAAVVVQDITGLPVRKDMDRGYLTLAMMEKVAEELVALERRHGLKEGMAWMELSVACSKRMFLTKDEEKNSESPSPSEMTQPASNETNTSAPDGKSTGSARSKKTRETA